MALDASGWRPDIQRRSVALGVDAKKLTRGIDSMSFCLPKRLAAPVGSMVCGSRTFIAEVRRNRKILGGGMRQAGVIAAAGIVALEQMVDRLTEDQANASRLAAGIAEIPGLSIDLARTQTNIIYFDLESDRLAAGEFLSRLDKKGIKLLCTGGSSFRMVTHHGIRSDDIDRALTALASVMKGV